VTEKPGEEAQDSDSGAAASNSSGGAASGATGGGRSFDIATFAAHPETWPKSVAIKAETEFPAVLNNKKVGTLRAPAGSEVHLVQVQNGKLGVEYQGGGKWLDPEATDLIQRVQGGR
jgi:hypothetical protein